MRGYEQLLAEQRQAQRHLSALLRLASMEQRASTPEAWEALLACKEKEIGALAELGLSRALQEARDLLAALPPGRPSALADLLSLNAETLGRVCALEAEAVTRASTQTEDLGAQVAATQRGTRLSAAYAPAGSPRFFDRTR